MLPNPGQASAHPIPTSCRCFQPRPGICKSNSNKLWMLPTPGYASANPIPTSCRCFQPRPGICKSNSSKLQMLPRPEFTPICICKSNSNKLQMLPTLTRHLQIQFQQVADASNPGQASANPIPTSCRCFQPWPGIYKSNSSKLQMLPTPARHLQIQFQQIADASDPDQASANPTPASCRCFRPRPGIYKSNSSKLQMLTPPGYVSANSYPANCRCFRPRPGICSSQNNKSKMPTGEFSSQIRWWASLLHLYFIK